MRPSPPSPTVIDLRDRVEPHHGSKGAITPHRAAAPHWSPAPYGPCDHIDVNAHAVSDRSLRTARLAALWTMVALNIVDLFVNRSFAAARAADADARAVVLFGGGAMPWMKGAVLVALGWAVLRTAPRLSTTCAMWCVVGVYALATWMNLAVLIVAN